MNNKNEKIEFNLPLNDAEFRKLELIIEEKTRELDKLQKIYQKETGKYYKFFR